MSISPPLHPAKRHLFTKVFQFWLQSVTEARPGEVVVQCKDMFAVVETLYVVARGGVVAAPCNLHVCMKKAILAPNYKQGVFAKYMLCIYTYTYIHISFLPAPNKICNGPYWLLGSNHLNTWFIMCSPAGTSL